MNTATTSFEIIKCHGSGNDFIMIDISRDAELQRVDWSAFARLACDREQGIGSDGLLLVERHADGVYGMDMLNPDGTHAEMCGNGIRCVARLASERGYLARGVLRSGGRDYKITEAEPVAQGIEAFAVDIPIRRWSPDFGFFAQGESFVGRVIEGLDTALQFTALNLGNPHIVAAVDSIDMELLKSLGERVIERKELFPRGVNVSLYECRSRNEIFVATYERGAGITLSCGTAMTASATAASLLNLVERGCRVEVRNRGGRVFCTTELRGEDIVTRLEGNATFEWWGSASFEGGVFDYRRERDTDEGELWSNFVISLNR
jgi:diaminopimelate epimerase